MPPRTMATGAVEVAKVRSALADRYRIERVLGEGGMATVYLAEDLKHHRKVAVKVMRPELAATLGADRFLREIEIAAQLSHPHILPVHDSGDVGRRAVLRDAVRRGRVAARAARSARARLPVDEALRLAPEVAEALALRARAGHRPPGHQAGQHPAERGARAGGGLRDRAGPDRRRARRSRRPASRWGRRST